MAYVRRSRVRATTAAPGTGDAALTAVSGPWFSFAVLTAGDTCHYVIADQSGTNHEFGLGTYQTGPSRIVRLAAGVINGTAGPGTLTNFSGGTQDVFIAPLAEVSLLSTDPLCDAKGDLFLGTAADTIGRLAVGGNGQAPIADSSQATGVLWGDVIVPSVNDFRLTTESGVPVSTSDRTAQSTLYLTPYKGQCIATYDSSVWTLHSSAQVSLALSGLTSGKNYDVFAYWTGSAIALELSAAWTNDTTRADAVTQQNGVWVKSTATGRRLIGTIRTTGTTTTEDSALRRFVANAANRKPRFSGFKETTDSWTYNTNAWRALVGGVGVNGGKVEFVCPLGDVWVHVILNILNFNSTGNANSVGLALDAVSAPTAGCRLFPGTVSAGAVSGDAVYTEYPSAGYHYLQGMEIAAGAGTSVFYGDVGVTYLQGGMAGWVEN